MCHAARKHALDFLWLNGFPVSSVIFLVAFPWKRTLCLNPASSLATRRNFSLLRAGFPYELSTKKSKLEHRCRHFEQWSAARPRFRDPISSQTFSPNGFRRAGLVVKRLLLSETCSKLWNDSTEDSETEKENIVCWPREECQVSCRFFSIPPISSRTKWRHINTNVLSRASVQNEMLNPE